MASGDTLFILYPQDYVPPAANYATLDTITDASTPSIVIPVLDFDGSADEHADWLVELPSHYSGTTGITFKYKYAVDGTDVDIVELEFRALEIADLDILTADLGIDTQTAVAIQDTPAATSTNKLNITTTGALAKASFGSAVAGALLLIRATRNVAVATNTDDLQLVSITGTET